MDYRWLIDDNNDGVPDLVLTNPVALNGLPAAGNFDGDPANGDEVALKVGNIWYLDTDHSLTVDDSEKLAASNMVGYPIVGDFDGDGIDDLGSRTDDVFSLNLSTLGPIDGVTDVQFKMAMNSAFIGVQERPIAADFDGDGIDDIGLWVPRHSAGTPLATGEWYILVSDEPFDPSDRIRVNPQDGGNIVDFVPVPFGAGRVRRLWERLCVAGGRQLRSAPHPGADRRRRVRPDQLGRSLRRQRRRLGRALDVLILVNELNLTGPRSLGLGVLGGPFLDVNEDSQLTAADVLAVINRMNQQAAGEGEGGTAYAALEVPLDIGPAASNRHDGIASASRECVSRHRLPNAWTNSSRPLGSRRNRPVDGRSVGGRGLPSGTTRLDSTSRTSCRTSRRRFPAPTGLDRDCQERTDQTIVTIRTAGMANRCDCTPAISACSGSQDRTRGIIRTGRTAKKSADFFSRDRGTYFRSRLGP